MGKLDGDGQLYGQMQFADLPDFEVEPMQGDPFYTWWLQAGRPLLSKEKKQTQRGTGT